MSRARTDAVDDISSLRHSGVALPVASTPWLRFDLSVLQGSAAQADWLTWTLFGLAAVLCFGLLGGLAIGIARRFGRLDYRRYVRVRRLFELTFGAALLSSICLPYLLLHVPMETLLPIVVILAVLGPLFARRDGRRPDSGPPAQC